jgi:hypothetical protein
MRKIIVDVSRREESTFSKKSISSMNKISVTMWEKINVHVSRREKIKIQLVSRLKNQHSTSSTNISQYGAISMNKIGFVWRKTKSM